MLLAFYCLEICRAENLCRDGFVGGASLTSPSRTRPEPSYRRLLGSLNRGMICLGGVLHYVWGFAS